MFVVGAHVLTIALVRWFHLYTDALVYLESEEDRTFKGKVHFRADDTHVNTETAQKAVETIIIRSGSRVLRCRADTPAETTEWVKAIRAARLEHDKGTWVSGL